MRKKLAGIVVEFDMSFGPGTIHALSEDPES